MRKRRSRMRFSTRPSGTAARSSSEIERACSGAQLPSSFRIEKGALKITPRGGTAPSLHAAYAALGVFRVLGAAGRLRGPSARAPIQIHYGTRVGRVYSGTPPEWSLNLTQALRDAGKEVELYQYENEGHSFVGQPWFDFMNRVLQFFNRNLK